jgi:Tfp pilus assembly protein PilN
VKFLKKIGLKIKIALGVVLGVVTLVLYFVVGGRLRAKDQLNYELSKLRNEIEINKLEEETIETKDKIKVLEDKESVLREKLSYLESEEAKGNQVSLEELDDFFKNRGF